MDKSTHLNYKIFEKQAYPLDESIGISAYLTLDFIPAISGRILIGSLSFDIESGHVFADLRRLADGEHSVTVYLDSKIISAGSIIKSDGSVKLSSLRQNEIRDMIVRLLTLEERLAEQSSLISLLQKKIEGVSIL